MAYGALDHAGGAGVTTLAAQLASGTTTGTFTVADATGYPTGPHYVLIGPTEDLDSPSAIAEKIKVDSRSGNVFTFTTGGRAVDGTTAATHPSGSKVLHVFTATEAAEANDAVVQTIGKVTTAGDMIVASGANQFSRVAKGADGTVFRVASGSPGWGALPADSVTATQIAAGAVGTSEIATDGVGTAEIAATAVTADELAASVAGAGLTGGAGTALAVGAGSGLAVNANDVQIANSGVTNAMMADDAIDSAEIADGAVDLVHMSANSVDSDQYVDGSIDTAHIGDDQVTNAKLADDAVDSDQIADGAVDPAHLASLAGNKVLEGPSGGGTPVATERGRSWMEETNSNSGNITTTPTAIAALNIATPALKAGRRYRMEFCAQMAMSAAASGFAYVQFRKGGTLQNKMMTSELALLTSVAQTVVMYYEPGSDETANWDIYIEAVSDNVKIIAAATQRGFFAITDVGLATNL